jgi:hypothetical protein
MQAGHGTRIHPGGLLILAAALLAAGQHRTPGVCSEVEATGFAAGDPLRLAALPPRPTGAEARDALRRDPLRCLTRPPGGPGPCTGVTWLAGNRAAVAGRGEADGAAFYRVTLRMRLESGLGEVQLYVREANAPCVHLR